MAIRKIVEIDEKKCNGCGLCIPNCVEGALQIVNGKAKLTKDVYCDGLGACLGHCPQDAISIIEREAEDFDEEEVEKYNSKKDKENINISQGSGCKTSNLSGGCPGSRMRQFGTKNDDQNSNAKVTSKLTQWPVQLSLVSPQAPYFMNSDLLITADCVPFAYGNYHNDFLKGKSVVVGCPKLDDIQSYTEKLEKIISFNDLESITVLRMEVPCCGGIASAAKIARDKSGINIPIKIVTIGVQGEIVKKEYV